MSQVDIKIATQYDGSGLSRASQGLDELQKKLAKKFSIPDLGKELLNGLGIGNGLALASTIKDALVKPFEDAAKAAEDMLASTEKSLASLEAMLKLRRTDAQELAKLRADDARLAKQAEAERAAAQEKAKNSLDVTALLTGGGVVDGAALEENKKIADITAQRQAIATEIQALELKIKSKQDELRSQTGALIASRTDDEKRLANAKAYLAVEERAVQITTQEREAGRNTPQNIEKANVAWLAREKALQLVSELQAKVDAKAVDAAKNDLEAKQLLINQKLAELEADFTRTDADKWAEKKKLQEDALKAAQDYLAVMKEIRANATTEDAKRIGDTNVRAAAKDVGRAQTTLAGAGADPNAFFQQFQVAITDLENQWGSAAQRMGEALQTSIGGATAGLSTSIQGLLNRTMTWGQSLRNVWTSFRSSMVSALADTAAKYLATKAVMWAIDVAFAAKGLLLSAAQAAKSLILWLPSAIAASISSYGLAAGIGAAAVAVALVAANNFDVGGYTPGGPKNKPAGVVHAGEWVAPQWMVNSPSFGPMIDSLEGARKGGGLNLTPNLARPDYGKSSGSGSNGGSGAGDGSAAGDIHVAFHDTRPGAEAWLRSREGQKFLGDMAQKHIRRV